jgi:hypothetical protein
MGRIEKMICTGWQTGMIGLLFLPMSSTQTSTIAGCCLAFLVVAAHNWHNQNKLDGSCKLLALPSDRDRVYFPEHQQHDKEACPAYSISAMQRSALLAPLDS